MINNYTKHLLKNWYIAGHALKDCFCHLIHGLVPVVKIKHHQAVRKEWF